MCEWGNIVVAQIPELIVMAVLAPSGKRVTDIKAFTGVHIDTGKKSTADPNNTIVTLQVRDCLR